MRRAVVSPARTKGKASAEILPRRSEQYAFIATVDLFPSFHFAVLLYSWWPFFGRAAIKVFSTPMGDADEVLE
jgi:hypothetical protein